ncbi:MAG: hypothetical protein KKB82_05100 [Candidatus Omnitrophica bacterium]|nr:hypothetical protein [Candidatus Omnitrophota bacterium]MBU1925282.1 hypothetical protein [Candidatus Omnitrophota bacterium]MBU2064126.1 hypothetical protein [Candidatus Omnitrophota bacterium]
MRTEKEFITILERICSEDKRYKIDAYYFILASLSHILGKLNRQGHISGRELLEGIKDYAIKLYGRMARSVFEHWGVSCTEDFGNIVFNMVESKLLGKTDTDKIEDFKQVYDFKTVFEDDYCYE